MSGQAKSRLEHAELLMVVTRADGTVEDLGVVAVYDAPKHWWNKLLRLGRTPTTKKVSNGTTSG